VIKISKAAYNNCFSINNVAGMDHPYNFINIKFRNINIFTLFFHVTTSTDVGIYIVFGDKEI